MTRPPSGVPTPSASLPIAPRDRTSDSRTPSGAGRPAASPSEASAIPGLQPSPDRPRGDPRPGLSGLDQDALLGWLEARGLPAYRARQIADGVWRHHAHASAELRSLPGAVRAAVDESFRVDTIAAEELTIADGGLTEKALHYLADGVVVESVLMHYPARGERRSRETLCISSQAGCAVGCPFCATGELGFGRDLDTAEIVDQVRSAARRLARTGGHLTNVVFMGMGEPLLNLDRVLESIAALADPGRFGLGARHVTVSTSGVVPGMRRLTRLGPQFTLAVSLHAARDALRDVLVPLNRRWPVAEVVAAARDHARATGRRVSYEYVMIGGVNDTPLDAIALADLLRGDLAHVNLIPMNQVAHTPWSASAAPVIASFAEIVRRAGISVTIRRNRGQEAGAACGQLAAARAGEPAPAAVALRRERIVAASLAALQGERSREPLPDDLAAPADRTAGADLAAPADRAAATDASPGDLAAARDGAPD